MEKGFTLIELIIVVLLFTVLAAAASWTFAVGLRSWYSDSNRAGLRQDGNLAIERMVRDLGQAYSIRTAEEGKIEFWADADGDEEITFDVDGSNLERTTGGVATILAPYVETFTLSYRDTDNALMTLPQDTASQKKRDNIRVITISLTLDNGDEAVTLSSSVYTRNQGLS